MVPIDLNYIPYDLSFIEYLDNDERKIIIKRIKRHANKADFINLLRENPNYNSFLFELIYDDNQYIEDTINLLLGANSNEYYERFLSFHHYNLNEIYQLFFDRNNSNDEDSVIIFLRLLIFCKIDFNEYLFNISNLHYRALLIKEILQSYAAKFNKDNLLAYFKDAKNKISENDASDIAIILLDSNDLVHYNMVKEFILNNYKTNDLGKKLLRDDSFNSFQAFTTDADKLFISSKTFGLDMYHTYSDLISREVIAEFDNTFGKFLGPGREFNTRRIFEYGLSKEIKRCLEMYLDLSQDKTCKLLSSGTTADCYQVGDFVLKLIINKWSREDVICPNLFLIIKNFEEIYIRDKSNNVVAGIEVQKYLRRKANNLSTSTIIKFTKELASLGYCCTDIYAYRPNENLRILDTYLDADTKNPENLPDWFKRTPLVLVDRDLVYREDEFKKNKSH
jgi:hypothetical protein